MSGPNDNDVNDDVRNDILDAWDTHDSSADDAQTLDDIRSSIETSDE